MHYLIQDPVQWLVWHVVWIKHWFNNCKRKQNDSSSVDQQSRQKRKARASLSLKRLTAWDSIFWLGILQNPNIQNPAHPDWIRLRFRVPHSVFAAIVHMFIIKDCWNPVSASDFYGKPSHQSHCSLTIQSGLFLVFSITFARKWPLCFTSTYTCQLEMIWQLFFLYTLEWDFLDLWEVQVVYISIGINASTMWGTYISTRRGNQQ